MLCFGRQLGHCALLLGQVKDGIVAETADALRPQSDDAFNSASGRGKDLPIRSRQSNSADKTRFAISRRDSLKIS